MSSRALRSDPGCANLEAVELAVFASAQPLDVAVAAAISASALDRALARDAELVVRPLAGDALVLGAFQRRAEVETSLPVFRRGSGGHAVRAGDGVLFVHLALAHPAALFDCDAERLLNRYVRPILAALTKVVAPARYFGRDWIAMHHRPVAFLGFGHDATSGRASIDAFVGVSRPYVDEARASFRGKSPLALDEVQKVALTTIVDAIAGAFAAHASTTPLVLDPAPAPPAPADARWTVQREDAMGTVAAGRDAEGHLRVGGEIMASRDAVVDLDFLRRGAVSFGVRRETLAEAAASVA